MTNLNTLLSNQLGKLTVQVAVSIKQATMFASDSGLREITPEVMLLVIISQPLFDEVVRQCAIDIKAMDEALREDISVLERTTPPTTDIDLSQHMVEIIKLAYDNMRNETHRKGDRLFLYHILHALTGYEGTMARAVMCDFFNEPLKILRLYRKLCKEQDDGQFIEDDRQDEFKEMILSSVRIDGIAPLSLAPEEYNTRAIKRIDDDPEYVESIFIGRQMEILRAATVLTKRERNNIILVGEHGVGKTKMVSGIIRLMKNLDGNNRGASEVRFYKLNLAIATTGVTYADEVENNIKTIIAQVDGEMGDGGMAVLFCDNISELMPQTLNDNTPDLLKLIFSLTEGTGVRIITTATFEQYKRFASHNNSIEKSFVRIDVAEPPMEPDVREIVRVVGGEIMDAHGCERTGDDVLDMIADYAARSHNREIAMPGRALDLVDSIGANIVVSKSLPTVPAAKRSTRLTRELIEETMRELGFASIVNQFDEEEGLRMLEPRMLEKIFGQDEAVRSACECVLLARAGLSDENKPLASFLFVGPTGVGKTELARVLAAELGVKMVRFDMSEYSEPHTVSRLVGSPAGYIGYEDGGLLTDAVRREPNCVLLLDEIEKSHSAIFNLLLQVLDYGQLTDNKGNKVDFSGTIIIMTSNAGADLASSGKLGFGTQEEKGEIMRRALRRTFSPEFLNRMTQVIAFHDMSLEMAGRILDRKVSDLRDRLVRNRGVEFALSDAARELLLREGFSVRYGAREMDRAISRLLKPELMRALLFGGRKKGSKGKLLVDLGEGGKLVIQDKKK